MDWQPSYGNISIGEEYAEYDLEDQIIDESTDITPPVKSKSHKKTVQDICDEDNYTLARNSDDQANATSNESQKTDDTKMELREMEKTITAYKKIIIGLAIGILVLFVALGVCMYLAVTKNGNF